MGNRIVLLVPYRNATESYEERVEIVTRTRNIVISWKAGSTANSAVVSAG